jgi:hypothetical protein
MKHLLTLLLAGSVVLNFSACSTPEQRKAREERYRREDAEDARRARQRDSEDFQDFLRDYAHDLGKPVSALTASERAEARREFDRHGSHGYYGRGYWGW